MTNFQAPVQEETTSDIYRERSYSWRKMTMGYGDVTQQSNGAPARYFYASNAWHAGAMRGLGPRLRQLSLAAAEGEVAGFAEAIHVTGGAPVTRLFAIAGRYVRRWEGETGAEQALSLDLGAGIVGRSLDALDGRGAWAAGRPLPHRQHRAHRPPVALPGRGLDRPHRRRGAPRRLRPGHRPRAVAGMRHRRPAGRPLRRLQVRGQPPGPRQLDGAHRGG